MVIVTEKHTLSNDDFITAQKIIREQPGGIQLDKALTVDKLPISPTGKIQRSKLHEILSKGNP